MLGTGSLEEIEATLRQVEEEGLPLTGDSIPLLLELDAPPELLRRALDRLWHPGLSVLLVRYFPALAVRLSQRSLLTASELSEIVQDLPHFLKLGVDGATKARDTGETLGHLIVKKGTLGEEELFLFLYLHTKSLLDLEAADRFGRTVLVKAALSSNQEAVRLLFLLGANPHHGSPKTPLQIVKAKRWPKELFSPGKTTYDGLLDRAVKKGVEGFAFRHGLSDQELEAVLKLADGIGLDIGEVRDLGKKTGGFSGEFLFEFLQREYVRSFALILSKGFITEEHVRRWLFRVGPKERRRLLNALVESHKLTEGPGKAAIEKVWMSLLASL